MFTGTKERSNGYLYAIDASGDDKCVYIPKTIS